MNRTPEQKENDILLNKGFTYTVNGKTYEVKPLFLGTLDKMSEVLLKVKLDEKSLEEDPIGAYKHVVKDNAKLCAKVIAIATLRTKWRIRLFSSIFSSYLVWNITPNQLIAVYLKIIEMSDMGNFINSIRLMSGGTTTKPNPIEKQK